MRWAGLPAKTALSGISFVTTEPAPIMVFDPMVVPGSTIPDYDRADTVAMPAAHDINHDHRSVVAQQLTSGRDPDIVAEFDQMGIRDIGSLGDKAVITLGVDQGFLFEVGGVGKTA